MTKLRDESPPSFAALREGTRLYKTVLRQTLLAWPSVLFQSLVLGSGLESWLNRSKLIETLDQCLADFEAELGPFYSPVFDKVRAENPLRFAGGRSATLAEIAEILDQASPGWSQTLMIDLEIILATPLFQVHRMKGTDGQRWLLKVIKPAARQKLEATLAALSECQMCLRPFRSLPPVADFLSRLDSLGRKAQREADLRIERRALIRAQSHGETPAVHPRFKHQNVLVTRDPALLPKENLRQRTKRHPRLGHSHSSAHELFPHRRIPFRTA